MRTVVIGANGGTGRELVDRAVARRHHVVAFARHRGSVDARSGVVGGHVEDDAALTQVLPGADAVLLARLLNGENAC